jgi:hypothetical protein
MVGVGVAVEEAVTTVVVRVVAGVVVTLVTMILGAAADARVVAMTGVPVVPVIVTFPGAVVMAGMVVVMAVARMAAVTGLGVRIACHFVPVATSGRPLATL